MRVVLLFIDGVGIGVRDPALNPLAREAYLLSQFADGSGEPMPGGGAFHSVDATFELAGRPQSASNQTAILTGDPAPALIGRHVLGFPDRSLRELLAQRSIVKRLVESERRGTFANCYPAGYLDALGLDRRPSEKPDVVIPPHLLRKVRASATTLAMAAGKVPLRTLDDARAGRGLTNDIDGARAVARGFEVPQRTAVEAAAVLWAIAEDADFTLFEHYLADEAGHARDFAAAQSALGTFDRFARAVIATRPPDATVLICSDHGNVEDLSLRNHTRNRVPVLSFGAEVPSLATVADVGTSVLRLIDVER